MIECNGEVLRIARESTPSLPPLLKRTSRFGLNDVQEGPVGTPAVRDMRLLKVHPLSTLS